MAIQTVLAGFLPVALFTLALSVQDVAPFQFNPRPVASSLALSPQSHGRVVPTKIKSNEPNKLRLASASEPGSDGADSNLESADLRREQQYIKYKTLGVVWFLEPLIREWVPLRVMAEQARGELFLLPKVGYTMGMLLASGLSSILASAAFHDRLSSDAYKRLNLIVLGFSILTLSAFLDNIIYVTPAAGIVGIFAAYDGYVNGVRGFHSERNDDNYKGCSDIFNDLKEGIMQTSHGMFKARNPRAFGYLAITWLFTLVNVLHNIPLFYKLFWHGTDLVKTGSIASTIARLWIVSGISFTLKDASDRGRLHGTTFIQLNALGGAWAGLVSLAAIAPKFIPNSGLLSDKAVKVASALLPIGVFFSWNALIEILKNGENSKNR